MALTNEARALAKVCGAAQRAYPLLVEVARLCAHITPQIAIAGNAVLEEIDLLRHFLREQTLRGVIEAPTPDETRASFKAAEAEIETLRRARTRAATLAAVKATKARSATRVPAKATCVTTTSKREKRHGTSTDYQD